MPEFRHSKAAKLHSLMIKESLIEEEDCQVQQLVYSHKVVGSGEGSVQSVRLPQMCRGKIAK